MYRLMTRGKRVFYLKILDNDQICTHGLGPSLYGLVSGSVRTTDEMYSKVYLDTSLCKSLS
jgi:hypothetical protein